MKQVTSKNTVLIPVTLSHKGTVFGWQHTKVIY